MAMENVTKTVIDCIKYEICGQNEKIVLPEVSARFLIEVYKLSKAHDVAHLVGDALNKSGVFENLPADFYGGVSLRKHQLRAGTAERNAGRSGNTVYTVERFGDSEVLP